MPESSSNGFTRLFARDATLDIVAREDGWQNYTVYEKAWRANRASACRAQGFALTLSAHWAGTRTWGVEVAQVTLSAPWWTFLSLAQRRSVVAVSRFRIEGKDRAKLVSSSSFNNVENARHYAGKAARALAFVDALRVVPAKPQAVYKWLGVDFSDRQCPALGRCCTDQAEDEITPTPCGLCRHG